ncbi:hypothetical protein HDZ31DRAFT_63034 [Schizophyllum fasciatum]
MTPDTMPNPDDRVANEVVAHEAMRQQTPQPSKSPPPAATSNMNPENPPSSSKHGSAQRPREIRPNSQAGYLLFRQDFLRASDRNDGDEDEDDGDNAAAAAWKHLPDEERRAWERKVEGASPSPPVSGVVDGDGDVLMGQESVADAEQNNVASGVGQKEGDEPNTTLIAQGVSGEELGRRLAEWEEAQQHPASNSASTAAPAPAPPPQASYDFGYSRASIYPTSDSRTERGDSDGDRQPRPPSPGPSGHDGTADDPQNPRARTYTGPEGGFVPPGGFTVPPGFGPPPPGYTYYSPLVGGPPPSQHPPPPGPAPANGQNTSASRKKVARGAAKQAKASFAEDMNELDSDDDDDVSEFEGTAGGEYQDGQGSRSAAKPKARGKRKADGPSAAARKKQKKSDGDNASAPPPSVLDRNQETGEAGPTGPPDAIPNQDGDQTASASSPAPGAKKSANPRVRNKWACDYCSATFTRKYDRQRHLDSQICKTRSGNAMAAASHLTSADTLPPDPAGATVVPVPPSPSDRDVERTCTKCGHIFARRDAYLRHKNSDFNCETWKGTKGRKGRGRPTKNGTMAPGLLAAAAEAAGISVDQGAQGGSPTPQQQPQQQQQPQETGPPPVGQPLMFANPLMPQHMQMMMIPPGMQPPPGMPMVPYGPPPGMYAPVMLDPRYHPMPPPYHQYLPPPPPPPAGEQQQHLQQQQNGQQAPGLPPAGDQPQREGGSEQQQQVDPALHALDPALLEAVAKALAANPATAAAVAASQPHLVAAVASSSAGGPEQVPAPAPAAEGKEPGDAGGGSASGGDKPSEQPQATEAAVEAPVQDGEDGEAKADV